MSQHHKIYKEIQPKLQQVEDFRLAAISKKKSALIYTIVTIAVGLGLIPLTHFLILIPTVIIALLFYIFIPKTALAAFTGSFKHIIVLSVAKSLEPTAKYSPSNGFSKSQFISIGHYRTGIDRYESEDNFTATIGSTDVQFSEVHAQYKTTSTDSNGNSRTTWHSIFKGVMFTADFHKHFQTWVIIKPDIESVPVFGWISKKIQGISSSHLRMEDPEFEKHFKVNAGNDQQARYILTPDMQQRILKLRLSYGSKIIISFKDSNVNITAPKVADYYEPNIKESAFSTTQVARIATQIDQYFKLVKMLNLNTRIWTKD